MLADLFENKTLYDTALTHRSWVNENKGVRENNERMEFLGDAVLEFVVSQALYTRFPDKEEGYLTALRANLVNTVNLSKIALKLELGRDLHLSKGEEDGGGRENSSILADTVEAIIGALFIDGGLEKAQVFINKHLLSEIEEKVKEPLKDAKSRLQEKVQAQGRHAPIYKVVKEEGPDHAKSFTIDVMVDGTSVGQGIGKNKSEAAQNAAENALQNV